MLNIKFIRENKDIVIAGARKKHIDVDINKLINLDDKRTELLKIIDEKRAEQNKITKQIASEQDSERRAEMINQMKLLKEVLKDKEEELKKILKKWRKLMLQVPNVPDVSVPEGESDEENQEIRNWGEKTNFNFSPKSHIDIMRDLDMADFHRGAKVSGFRGYFLKNDGATLSWAIWQYAQDFFLNKGFTPVIAPSLVRKESLMGTGYIPGGEEDLYATQDESYLAGTSEVAVMGYYMDEILKKADLPVKFLAFSPCFRREAGAYGKDTKGLIRVHEFYKWEQVILCEASHEESVKWHEWLNRNTEEFIESLNIPYRTVVNCGGDLGLGQVKKYDIELWVPKEQKYREIASTSYFHDFQTRRLAIRYKADGNKTFYAHSLNGTAAPTPRLLVSILENNQQEDGSVAIPEALKKYMNKEKIENRLQLDV